MTNEELVIKIQQGERDLLLVLWEQVRNFVVGVAMKWAKAEKPDAYFEAVSDFADDLIQSGFIALVEAVDAFDATQENKFLTLLGFYLKKHFGQTCADASGWSRYARSKKGAELHVYSLNAPLKNSESDSLDEFGDFIADPKNDIADAEELIYQQELHTALERALGKLEPDEEQVIRAKYYEPDGPSQAAAEVIGAAKGQAGVLEQKALRKMRQSKELDNFIEQRTPYFLHVGVTAFHSTNTSAVERIVEIRERMRLQKGENHV